MHYLKSFVFNNKIGNRLFYKWVNTTFNKVDYQRIKEVGSNRAAAEWLLRCGASVKWKDKSNWISDYNALETEIKHQYVIEEIDATESCIMNIGFDYLDGLKHLKKFKFFKCIYLENACLHKLSESEIKNSLEDLEVVSCGNVSDDGILAITKLKKLKMLHLYDLPEVKEREKCLIELQKSLPSCDISFPITSEGD